MSETQLAEIAPRKNPVPPQLIPITAETARLRQAASVIARQKNSLKKAIALVRSYEPALLQAQITTDSYTDKRIARTRKQIELLDDKLAKCEEPKDLKAIADAIARLAEIERILSGRPLPGSRRPGKEPTQRQGTVQGPLDSVPPQ